VISRIPVIRGLEQYTRRYGGDKSNFFHDSDLRLEIYELIHNPGLRACIRRSAQGQSRSQY
jgi:hypothetical protein